MDYDFKRRRSPVDIGHRSVMCCLFPTKMKPDRKAFEKLGFQFYDLKSTEVCQGWLPIGWRMEVDVDGQNLKSLIDEFGKIRGQKFYDEANHTGYMKLFAV